MTANNTILNAYIDIYSELEDVLGFEGDDEAIFEETGEVYDDQLLEEEIVVRNEQVNANETIVVRNEQVNHRESIDLDTASAIMEVAMEVDQEQE